ncbi:MAG: NADPH-dependent 7-cyano-7-deazaguanine reductase QueF [Deferrisomatales bacterium]|nr:NADPH-dependent 7-cyano-7-deazaguanine reductase QueF [Deferrisomatales bacterium]
MTRSPPNRRPSPLNHLDLGRDTGYPDRYDPALLQGVPRSLNRDDLGLTGALPFHGADAWTAFELSWLDPRGKPQVAIGQFVFPCTSPQLVESKSLKLYLNGFNQVRLRSAGAVQERITEDLTACAGAGVTVELLLPNEWHREGIASLPGECIDDLPVAIDVYGLNPELLDGAASGPVVTETLHSNLLKSNCLVTNQPDWGSVLIRYRGSRISREALLRYLISYRQHSEFHEQCVERVFCDIMHHCRPTQLTVYARYTRRGGLDINPFRSNFETPPGNARLARQ